MVVQPVAIGRWRRFPPDANSRGVRRLEDASQRLIRLPRASRTPAGPKPPRVPTRRRILQPPCPDGGGASPVAALRPRQHSPDPLRTGPGPTSWRTPIESPTAFVQSGARRYLSRRPGRRAPRRSRKPRGAGPPRTGKAQKADEAVLSGWKDLPGEWRLAGHRADVAVTLAETSADVAILYRSRREGRMASCARLGLGRPPRHPADVGGEAWQDRRAAIAELSRLDVLVNNAGIADLVPAFCGSTRNHGAHPARQRDRPALR